VHAASVGETNAVLPVIEALGAARPNLNILLTTGTVTSASLAERRLPACAVHQYVPLDAPEYAARFLDHWRPDLAVLTESEIWPSLILETSARGIPLILVNARLSNRSRRRWQRNKRMAHPLFNRFDVVLAQNERLALGFAALGARNVQSVGNLKIDAPPPPVDLGELERLRSALDGRPLFVAASTHEGEEEIVAQAHRELARAFERFLTIIAPRHPERGTAIAERLKDLGLSVAQRSLGALPSERTDVYVADTIGELGTLYALAPIAFIGGSLVERGGQNPIEAVRHGVAVLTGPHHQNFRDAYRTLLRHQGAIEVGSAKSIAAAVSQLTVDQLRALERGEPVRVGEWELHPEDVTVTREVAGDWLVQADGPYVVALDPQLTEDLVQEGLAREVVNRVQRLRKEAGYEYTTRIELSVAGADDVVAATGAFQAFVEGETLARRTVLGAVLDDADLTREMDIEGRRVTIALRRHDGRKGGTR